MPFPILGIVSPSFFDYLSDLSAMAVTLISVVSSALSASNLKVRSQIKRELKPQSKLHSSLPTESISAVKLRKTGAGKNAVETRDTLQHEYVPDEVGETSIVPSTAFSFGDNIITDRAKRRTRSLLRRTDQMRLITVSRLV